MSDLHNLTALEQQAALAARKVSSRELTEHYLRRIDLHGDRLGAFTSVFHEQALQAADAADAASGPRGSLHGLPLVLKDLHPTAGLRTTMGSAAMAAWVPTADAPAVGALRQAGAVVLGKTHAPEFGPVCYTESAVAPDCVTPYDERLSASGSSGGSAAAVAARLAPFGHASDGLGSIRTPAANCGLVGVKPSRGRLRGSGLDWLAFSVEGPVARTVGDAALLLDAIGPVGPEELWAAHGWAGGAHQRAAARPPEAGLRIGCLVDPGIDVTVHDDCLAAVAATRAVLVAMGHEVSDVPAGDVPALGDLQHALITVVQARIALGVAATVPAAGLELLMPFTRWLLEQAKTLSAVDLLAAQTRLAAASGAWLGLQSGYDVLLTPTTTAPAQPVGSLRLDDASSSVRAMLRWSAFTPWANLTGAPAVSLPVHRTASGVPVGVQFAARPGQDEVLLSLAGALEGVFRWQDVHPPAASG